MALVDPRTLESPLKRTLSELDREMSEILESNITDHEKVTRYNQVLHKYREYHTQFNKPLQIEFKPSVSDQPSFNRLVEDQILNVVPSKMRTKAAQLIDLIKNSDTMSWNDRGEFVYRGKPVPNTHMVDLVGDAIRFRKSVEPENWRVFASALSELSVPEELIGNKLRWRYMRNPEGAREEVFSTPLRAPPQGRLARGRASPVYRSKTPIRPGGSPLLNWEET